MHEDFGKCPHCKGELVDRPPPEAKWANAALLEALTIVRELYDLDFYPGNDEAFVANRVHQAARNICCACNVKEG